MLAGDPTPIRDVGHTSWVDPLAALEDTKGPAFLAAMDTLEAQWRARRKRLSIRAWQSRIHALEDAANPETEQYAQDIVRWNGVELKIHYAASHRLTVWIGAAQKKDLAAFLFDPATDLYATIKDVGSGSERLELAVYRYGTAAPLYTQSPVGPDAAFCGEQLAYLTVDNALRYDSVVAVDKTTGKGKRTLYESKDKQKQLELLAPPRQTDVFVREFNALERRIGYLTRTAVRWMTPAKKTTMLPLSKTAWVENRHLVLRGRRIPLPHGEFAEDAAPWGDEFLLVTVKDACCSLYQWSTHFTTLLKSTTPNQIRLSPYGPTAVLSYPDAPTEVWDLHDIRPLLTFPTPLRLTYSVHGHAKSKDGTLVPYTLVAASASPRKLIVEAYGAYGISGHRSYPVKWLAYLERGYALAVVFPRGGRENGDAWWQGGSTALQKHHTFEDIYAAIKASQHRLSLPVRATMFYGRSAGGWAAARVAQHEPPIVGAVLAEVPYVDVLRTTSNPRLPLTQMEYDEFGDPRRASDYAALRQLSPVDTVRPAPSGAPTVLVRTALHDMEVSPYEAVKWVTALQAQGWTALLLLDRDGGHFAAEKKRKEQAAENAAFLDAALRHGSPTRKRMAHVSKGMTSRATRRQKHRTVASTSLAAL
jgi:hypothetical protein